MMKRSLLIQLLITSSLGLACDKFQKRHHEDADKVDEDAEGDGSDSGDKQDDPIPTVTPSPTDVPSAETFSYDLTGYSSKQDKSCSTGEKTFLTLREMCLSVQSEVVNDRCAWQERRDLFTQKCAVLGLGYNEAKSCTLTLGSVTPRENLVVRSLCGGRMRDAKIDTSNGRDEFLPQGFDGYRAEFTISYSVDQPIGSRVSGAFVLKSIDTDQIAYSTTISPNTAAVGTNSINLPGLEPRSLFIECSTQPACDLP